MAEQNLGETPQVAAPVVLSRKITITETFEADGTRSISDIAEVFLNPQGLSVAEWAAVDICLESLGVRREREQLPQADNIGRYPNPVMLSGLFHSWPPESNVPLVEPANLSRPGCT
jgi:hypothetical protein